MPRRSTIIIPILVLSALIAPLARAACNFHNLSGWIWSANFGWISLSCQNTGAAVDYGLDINFASGAAAPLTGYAWSSNLGWLNFQPTAPFPAAPNNAARFTRNAGASPTSTAGVITGWAKFAALGDDGWMKLGPLVFDGIDYGVKVATDRAFSGWSFNGGDDLGYPPPGADQGAGWVSWQDQGGGGGGGGGLYGGGLSAYWFETLYGDIYSGRSVSAPFAPPAGRYNATYLIQADGSINPITLRSSGGSGPPWRAENFGPLALPQASNSYRGTLGNLDRSGILAGYYGPVTTWLGNRTSSATLGASRRLNGRVFYITGNFTVNSALTFLRGNSTQDGNGAIVVDGNLIVNADILYEAGVIATRIDKLPSAGWLVRGNITVSPSVSSMAGVFFSEGAAGFSTGTAGTSAADRQLIVSGAVIAKKITLQRLWTRASNEPAEQFIFDGRPLVNPPPGFIDMIKWLPTWQEVTP